MLLHTDMNSINDGWDSTKRAEKPHFHCGPSIPQIRKKMREKGE